MNNPHPKVNQRPPDPVISLTCRHLSSLWSFQGFWELCARILGQRPNIFYYNTASLAQGPGKAGLKWGVFGEDTISSWVPGHRLGHDGGIRSSPSCPHPPVQTISTICYVPSIFWGWCDGYMAWLGIVHITQELTLLEDMAYKQLYIIHCRKPYSEACIRAPGA